MDPAISEKLLDDAADIARTTEARTILVYGEVFADEEELRDFLELAGDTRVVLVTRRDAKRLADTNVTAINVPDINLTRVGQIKVAVLIGLAQGVFQQGETLVCLTGMASTGRVDGLLLMEVGKEFELFSGTDAEGMSYELRPDVVQNVMDMAVSLGNEGREGKPVGTTFVIGDTESVLEHSTQMVLNPFKGYTREERDIRRQDVQETIKEFSPIDGAFLITADGYVEAAGVFLQTAGQSVEIPRGLGARHRSAAAITALTDATAITVSETTGNVTVFRDGRVTVEIEKPRPIGPETAGKRRFFGVEAPGVDYETGQTNQD